MSALLQYSLIGHIVFGLLGIIAFYGLWMILLKQELAWKFSQFSSLGGLIFLLLSWVSGGYYYVRYYGKAVKPIIKTSQSPWAHAIFMESKEHVFLFLPFLATVVLAIILLLGKRLEGEPKLKRPFVFITGLIVVLGIIIALSGIIISGAVR